MGEPDNSYEESVVAAHSTPSLRRNQLTRASKKLNLEFDATCHRMSKAERDDLLDRIFPEEVPRATEKIIAPESNLGLTDA